MAISSVMSRTLHRPKPALASANSTTRRAHIELQTENGFSIVRRCDFDKQTSLYGTEHCFVVTDPHGYELEITVDFSAAAVADAIKRSCGHLTRQSAYWITAAEHRLADYLWENEDYPPDGRITIDALTANDVDLAQRWSTSKEDC